jgi:hypothetical protein
MAKTRLPFDDFRSPGFELARFGFGFAVLLVIFFAAKVWSGPGMHTLLWYGFLLILAAWRLYWIPLGGVLLVVTYFAPWIWVKDPEHRRWVILLARIGRL